MFKNITLLLVILVFCLLTPDSVPAAFRVDEQNSKTAKTEDKKDKKTKDDAKRGKLAAEFEKKKAFYLKQLEKDADFRSEVEAAYRDKLREHGEYAAAINSLNSAKTTAETPQSPLLKFDALYDNPLVTDYINRVGQSLVPKDSTKTYSFKVTLDPIPETRALTTGTIYVSTGLLAMVDNEAQLAYLLAHEIAHVEREHWKDDIVFEMGLKRYANHKSLSKNLLSKILPLLRGPLLRVPADEIFPNVAEGILSDRLLGSLPQILGSDKLNALLETPYINQNLPDILKLFAPGSVIAWDKVQEDEADDIAVKLLLDRKYDPREALRLMSKMREESGTNKRLAVGFIADVARVSGRIGELQTRFAGLQAKFFDQKLNVGAVDLTKIAKDAGIGKIATDTFNSAANEVKKQTVLKPGIEAGARLNSLENALGDVQGRVESGELLAGREEFQIIASELKRDNGIRSLNFDQFDTARKQLAEALEINASDPQTNYYLGLLTRETARSLKDKTNALEMLAKAVKNDPSGLLPNSRFERAVAILEATDNKPSDQEKQQIADMLREYVSLYRKINPGQNPANINRVNDYLRLIGQNLLDSPNMPQ
jgi:predicted Zn-dependent protease